MNTLFTFALGVGSALLGFEVAKRWPAPYAQNRLPPMGVSGVSVGALDPEMLRRVARTDTLQPGDRLPTNTRLKSGNRLAYLILQPDRNLVLYETATGRPLWASGTRWEEPPEKKFDGAVAMQDDGNLVLVDAKNRSIWSSAHNDNYTWYTLPKPGTRLVVQNDGNLVLYQGASAIWSTETDGFRPTSHHGHSVFEMVSDFANGAVEVVHKVPGVDWVGEQLKDFSRTTVGQWALRGIAATMFPLVGPGAATLLGSAMSVAAFTMPGLLRGEPVDQAFVNEVKSAIGRVAAHSGKAESDVVKTLGPKFEAAAAVLQKWADVNNIDFDRLANESQEVRNDLARELDPRDLAKRAGLSDDLAQIVIDGVTRTRNPAGHMFGPDGAYVPPHATTAQGRRALAMLKNVGTGSTSSARAALSSLKDVSLTPTRAPVAAAPAVRYVKPAARAAVALVSRLNVYERGVEVLRRRRSL